MTNSSEELFSISARLASLEDQIERPEVSGPLSKLQDAASKIGKAWSGSSIGYHANVYYENLEQPPPGARFSQEWGLMDQTFIQETRGSWVEYNPDELKARIRSIAGNPDLGQARELEDRAHQLFEDAHAEIHSILTTELEVHDDPFLVRLNEEIESLELVSTSDIIKMARGGNAVIATRDQTALGQGFFKPPHLSIFAEVGVIRNTVNACLQLSKIAKRAGSHIAKRQRRDKREMEIGTNVFIGHGRSLVWMELKEFIHDRLRLPWDEFNRIPVAGVTNITRLSQMLDDAAIAFFNNDCGRRTGRWRNACSYECYSRSWAFSGSTWIFTCHHPTRRRM